MEHPIQDPPEKESQQEPASFSGQPKDLVGESPKQTRSQHLPTAQYNSVNDAFKHSEEEVFWRRCWDLPEIKDGFTEGKKLLRTFIDHLMHATLADQEDSWHMLACIRRTQDFVRYIPLCHDDDDKLFSLEPECLKNDNFTASYESVKGLMRHLRYGQNQEFSIQVWPLGTLVHYDKEEKETCYTKWVVLAAEDRWIWLIDDEGAHFGDESTNASYPLNYPETPEDTGFDHLTCIRLRHVAELDRLDCVHYTGAQTWTSEWRIDIPRRERHRVIYAREIEESQKKAQEERERPQEERERPQEERESAQEEASKLRRTLGQRILRHASDITKLYKSTKKPT